MYRTNEMNQIIKYAEKEYNLSNWDYEFKDYTPQEIMAAFPNLPRYDVPDDADGIGGLCNNKTKTITLFWKGIKSYGMRRWILAHEIGHAVHYAHNSEISNADEQEQFADRIANEILDTLEL